MIFVTVGMQLPFDRMMRAVDAWCEGSEQGKRVFGQTGRLSVDNFIPRHFPHAEELTPEEFDRRLTAARLIVSHAGMGTIISALTLGKPIVVVPRRAHLGEQRNDHQVATVKKFADRPGVFVSMTERELPGILDRVCQQDLAFGCAEQTTTAQKSLISAVRNEIFKAGGSVSRERDTRARGVSCTPSDD